MGVATPGVRVTLADRATLVGQFPTEVVDCSLPFEIRPYNAVSLQLTLLESVVGMPGDDVMSVSCLGARAPQGSPNSCMLWTAV